MNRENKKFYEKREEIKDKKIDLTKKTNSFLFLNINNIYNSFESFVNSSNSFINSMENDLTKPLDDFIDNQLNFYNKNLNKIINVHNDFVANKFILDNSKNNYFHSSYDSNQADIKEIKNAIFRGENNTNSKRDNFIRKKMISRNDEFIFKYEVSKYNKNIDENNNEYNLLIDNILNLEKTKVHFVNSLLTKFKKYLSEYVKMINNFINEIDKFNNKEIGDQDILLQTKFFTKYREEMKKKKRTENSQRIFHFISKLFRKI